MINIQKCDSETSQHSANSQNDNTERTPKENPDSDIKSDFETTSICKDADIPSPLSHPGIANKLQEKIEAQQKTILKLQETIQHMKEKLTESEKEKERIKSIAKVCNTRKG